MNQNDQILISLYQAATVKDSYSIIKEYGQSLDQKNFVDLVQKYNQRIDPRQIEIFFRDILLHYKAEKISIFILDQLIRAGGKLSSTNERGAAQRAPHQIMSNINKTLKQKNLTVDRIFNIFDQDKDSILNDKEFKTFLNYYFPTLKPQEYDEIKKTYQNQPVTQQNLTFWLQDGSALQNSMKIAEPKQKVIQQLAPPQQKVADQPKQQQINKVLESNIFEDNERSDILTSNINFETVIIMDYAIPNVDKFVQIYNGLLKKKQKFQDSEFPPNQKSIGPELAYYDWKQISQIWNDADIFKKDTSTQSRVGLGKWIAPSDIKQGELGDCYFLSTLSSIACRWPDTIRSLFLTQKQNPQNIYCVKLCIDGKWQGIIIDDYIPIKYEQPAFTKSDDHSMWVMLLEKAYAKVFGSYYNIQSGISTEVMRALTGCTTFTLKTDQEDFDQQFFGSLQRKCILTSGSKSAEYGLIPKHAYSILKFIKDTHPSLGQLTLLKLRNPWGQKEWNGDWSDDSKLWTEQLKTKCKLKAKNDGTFFMSLNDFKKHFDQVSVGYYNKDFHYDSQSFIIKRNNSLYFKFDIHRDGGEYNIIVYQQSSRHHKDKVDYQYSATRLILAQQNKLEYILEDQKCKAENEVSIGGLLDGGTYLLQIKVEWKYWNEKEIIISQYGEKPIKLKQIKKIDFIKNTMLQFARTKSQLNPLDDNLKYSEYMKLSAGLGFQYFINNSNKTFKLTSKFSKFDGLKLKKPFRGNQFEIILKPKMDEIVMIKISPSGFNKQQNFEWISI